MNLFKVARNAVSKDKFRFQDGTNGSYKYPHYLFFICFTENIILFMFCFVIFYFLRYFDNFSHLCRVVRSGSDVHHESHHSHGPLALYLYILLIFFLF